MSTSICPQCGSIISRSAAQFCRTCGARLPAAGNVPFEPIDALRPGALLQAGRYKILREISRGGQGIVYEAMDTRLSRSVAVKIVKIAGLTTTEEMRMASERIRAEAHFLAALNHPNIVQVLDHFTEAGQPYVVMEYVNGVTLNRAAAAMGAFLPEAQAVFVGRQLCAALDYLHGQTPPVIFRDLKPENVMVDSNQMIKLIDFGIARTYKAGAHRDTLRFVSKGFAAPEQYGNGQTDQRSDIYSLGITLHHLVSGFSPPRDPFGAVPALRQLNSSISPEFEAVIMRAVEKKPENRWQTAAELDRELMRRPSSPTRFLKKQPAVETSEESELRPTTRLLMRIARYGDRELGLAGMALLALTVAATYLLGNVLLPVLSGVPFLAAVGPFAYAAARRPYVAGIVQAVASPLLGYVLTARILEPFGASVPPAFLVWMLFGGLAAGIAVEAVGRMRSVRKLFAGWFKPAWKAEAARLSSCGLLTFVIFYPTLWSGVQSLLYPLSWLLAPVLGFAGWFVGDMLSQYGGMRGKARPASR